MSNRRHSEGLGYWYWHIGVPLNSVYCLVVVCVVLHNLNCAYQSMHAVLLQYNMEKNRIFQESALNMGEILNLY